MMKSWNSGHTLGLETDVRNKYAFRTDYIDNL